MHAVPAHHIDQLLLREELAPFQVVMFTLKLCEETVGLMDPLRATVEKTRCEHGVAIHPFRL